MPPGSAAYAPISTVRDILSCHDVKHGLFQENWLCLSVTSDTGHISQNNGWCETLVTAKRSSRKWSFPGDTTRPVQTASWWRVLGEAELHVKGRVLVAWARAGLCTQRLTLLPWIGAESAA